MTVLARLGMIAVLAGFVLGVNTASAASGQSVIDHIRETG